MSLGLSYSLIQMYSHGGKKTLAMTASFNEECEVWSHIDLDKTTHFIEVSLPRMEGWFSQFSGC